MTAILRDLELEDLIVKGIPEPKEVGRPTTAEAKVIAEMTKKDAKARTRIELAVGDSEMIHLLGATTAKAMWDQLRTVKETQGRLGILSARRTLFRYSADESAFDMASHITKLRRMQEELHLMGSVVPDDDFAMILLTSLPEAWDNYTSGYLGSQGNAPTVNSSELIAVLLDEDRRKKGRSGDGGSGNIVMQVKETRECHNCKKKGHLAKDCWAKGGGKEGQGPKKKKGKGDRANQAQESADAPSATLSDIAYMVSTGDSPPPYIDAVFMTVSAADFSKYDWLLDCGASTHVCTIREAFTTYTPLENATIRGIGPGEATVLGKGTINLRFRMGNKTITHQLLNVSHVPSAPNCLMSQGRFDESGGRTESHDGKVYLMDKGGTLVGDGHLVNRLYLLHARADLRNNDNAFASRVQGYSWDEWHKRYGHLSSSGLARARRENMVIGLNIDESTVPSPSCDACAEGKMKHRPFPSEASNRSDVPGERTMTDVWGPTKIKSINGFYYFIAFTDDATRMCHVLFLKTKDQAFDRITTYFNHIEKQYGKVPKKLRLDNGKELVNEKLRKWCNDKGMVLEPSAPYSPSQNGVAERFNRTLVEMGQTMRLAAKLPENLWDVAISHATYLRNRSPTKALDKTPYEAWFGTKPDVSGLREFGCDVWVLDEHRDGKLAPKSVKGKFLGFIDGSKSVRYYDVGRKNVKVSRNYAFNENVPMASIPGLRAEGEPGTSQPNAAHNLPITDQSADQSADQTGQSPSSERLTIRIPARPPQTTDTTATTTTVTPNIQERPTRSTRRDTDYKLLGNPDARKPTDRSLLANDHLDQIDDLFDIALLARPDGTEPKNFKEAMSSEDRDEWEKAIGEEIGMLEKMGTWRLEDLPDGRTAVGCKWVFLKKKDENGNTVRFKARLVAQGFSQKPGIDYDDINTFAPVVRYETLRSLIAITATNRWHLNQFDIKNAYLNGVLHEEIYMRQPPGLEDGTGRVCRLQKTLYGLKQAGNVWNTTFTSALKDLSFEQMKHNYCVYLRRDEDKFAMLLLWVDDIIAITNAEGTIDQITNDLKRKFEIKSLGAPKFLLGIEVNYDRERRSLSLSLTHYINQVLEQLGLADCNPVATPLDPNVNLDYEEGEDLDGHSDDASYAYSALIGKLLRMATIFRVDISFAAGRLGQFTCNPKPHHWTATKRVFRYLKGTKDYRMWYGRKGDTAEEVFQIYCDADWASQANRKSVSGYIITLAGGAIAWSSKKQSIIALSTAEAEYVAATHVTKEVIWLHALFAELGIKAPTPTILSDNQAAIAIAHHPEFHARTKHIDIALHFVRDMVREGKMKIRYVRSEDNIADICTKGLPRPQHEKLTKKIGLNADPRGSVRNDGSAPEWA